MLSLTPLLTAAAAEDLPLPKGVKKLSPPYEAMMGPRRVTIHGFSTPLTLDEIRDFYLKALPKSRWTLAPSPWLAVKQQSDEAAREAQANQKVSPEQAAQAAAQYAGLTPLEKALKVKEQLQQVQKEHPELTHNQDFIQQSAKLDEAIKRLKAQPESVGNEPAPPQQEAPEDPKIEEMKRQQLYAERGTERLMLSFTPQEKKTLVYINRWEIPIGGDAAAGASETSWPAVNPCCSDLSVPESARSVPNSVPRYPNGRMISAGTAPPMGRAPGSSANEAYLTGDTVEQVQAFYRTQMSLNGWTERPAGSRPAGMDKALGEQAQYVNSKALIFRQNNAMCLIVASEYLMEKALAAAKEAAAASGKSAEELPLPKAEEGRTARTVVVVSFVDSPGREVSLPFAPGSLPKRPRQ
jgi:hypothetical protein